jgi:hypothetical protein
MRHLPLCTRLIGPALVIVVKARAKLEFARAAS